jgi:hypothetical protein
VGQESTCCTSYYRRLSFLCLAGGKQAGKYHSQQVPTGNQTPKGRMEQKGARSAKNNRLKLCDLGVLLFKESVGERIALQIQ